MSLDFDLTKIANWPVKKEDVTIKQWTDCLIWGCLFIDMKGITEKNYIEFHARLKFYHENISPIHQNKEQELFPSINIIREHIGLSTNVATRNFPQWMNQNIKKILSNRFDDVYRASEKEAKQ